MNVSSSATTASSTSADGSADSSGSGVGVAVAVNKVNNSNLAAIGSTTHFAAPILDVRTLDPRTSVFSASATSGAGGASNVGVAGALAINLVTNLSQASIPSTATIAAGGANVALSAADSLSNSASALPGSSSGGGGGGGAVGVGASVALNIVNTTVNASLQNGATLAGAGSLALSATSADSATTTAETGATAGTAVAPGVGIAIVEDAAQAELGTAGPSPLALGGALTLDATNSGATVTTVSASAAGANAAVGAAIALTFANDSAVATTNQNVSSGAMSLTAANLGASSAISDASASGAKGSDQSSGQTVDGSVTTQTNFAKAEAPSGTETTTDTPPSASASNGTSSQQVSVAAAVAVNASSSSASATIPSGITIVATGALSLSASNTSSGTATADASAVNLGRTRAQDKTPRARGPTESPSAQPSPSITSRQTMLQRLRPARTSRPSASFSRHRTTGPTAPRTPLQRPLYSGDGGGNIGVAGSLAINIVVDSTLAEIVAPTGAGTAATVNSNGDDLGISATDTAMVSTSALPMQNTSSGKFGLGASVALAVVNDNVIASVGDSTSLSGVKTLSLSATGSDTVSTQATMGSSGNISITPAVAVAIVKNVTTADIGSGSTLSVSGNLSATAIHSGSTTTAVQALSTASQAAIGAALALSFATDTTTATTNRNLNATSTGAGSISFEAFNTASSSAASQASASGSNGSGTAQPNVDQSVQNQQTFASGETPAGADGSSAAAPSASAGDGNSSSGTKISVAAAVAVNVFASTAQATIPANLVIDASGRVHAIHLEYLDRFRDRRRHRRRNKHFRGKPRARRRRSRRHQLRHCDESSIDRFGRRDHSQRNHAFVNEYRLEQPQGLVLRLRNVGRRQLEHRHRGLGRH